MHSRLFVKDMKTGFQFLVDSGAAVSCFPKKLTKCTTPELLCLYAANSTRINTYGIKTLELNLGLRRNFIWKFYIADVSHPLLGADFLNKYGLLVDVQNRRLVDNVTSLSIKGSYVPGPAMKLTLISDDTSYNDILQKFPNVFNMNLDIKPALHTVTHCIETKGPPVFCKARRLSPEKLAFLKKEFQTLMQQGIIRPSKSQWASPIHLVPKKHGEWRICGDFRRLNAIIILDIYPLTHIQDFCHGLAGKTILQKLI